MKKYILAIVIFFLFVTHMSAQEAMRPVKKIGVSKFPGYVEVNGNEISGMSVELIRQACIRLGYQCPIEVTTIKNIFQKLQNGEIDIALGALSIKYEREKNVDFTVPYDQSGLGIMVLKQGVQRRLMTYILCSLTLFGAVSFGLAPLIMYFDQQKKPEKGRPLRYIISAGQAAMLMSNLGFKVRYAYERWGWALTVAVMILGMLFYVAMTYFIIAASPQVMNLVKYGTLFVVLLGHLMWLAERGDEGTQGIKDQYFPGVLQAMWCVMTTISTVGYGDIAPSSWRGRFVACITMVLGIGFFGFVVSAFVTINLEQMETNIASLEDLQGKKVVSVAGSTSMKFVEGLPVETVDVTYIGEAYQLLLAGQVEAVVFDRPALHFFQRQNNRVMLLDQTLQPEYYGIAVRQGDQLREELTRAILQMEEDGYTTYLKNKYL